MFGEFRVKELDRAAFHDIALKVAVLQSGMENGRWKVRQDLTPIFFQDLEDLQNLIQTAFFRGYGNTSYKNEVLDSDPKQNSLYILQSIIGNFLTNCTLFQELQMRPSREKIMVLADQALSGSFELLRVQLQAVHKWIADFDQNKIGFVLREELGALAAPGRDFAEPK